MRSELAQAVAGLFAGFDASTSPATLEGDEPVRMLALADFAARARSNVEREGFDHQVELVPQHEAVARLQQALIGLLGGMRTIGVPDTMACSLVTQVGLDGMTKRRRAVLEHLVSLPGALSAAGVGDAVGYPTRTIGRDLEDLAAHGLVDRLSGGAGEATRWSATDETREDWADVHEGDLAAS